MLKAPLYHYNGKRPKPVVWDETLNSVGAWTSDGCHLINLLNNLIVFHCDRLGYYGLLQEVSHLDMDGNRYRGFPIRISSFLSNCHSTFIACFVTFAACTERNLDIRIPRYISEAL